MTRTLLCFQILINIFNFLPPNEWKAARVVCRRWFEILSDPSYCKKLPLVIENCTILPDTEPFSIFVNTPKERVFPYVEVGKVHYETKHKLDFNKMFAKIGKHTTDLKLSSKMDQNFLTNFPRLTRLQVKKIPDEKLYKPLPSSLKSLHVNCIDKVLSKTMIKRMKKHLKELTATWISIKFENCVALSEQFCKLKEDNEWLNGSFSTDKNLLDGKPVGVEDVTKIKVSGNIEDYTVLKEFKNLKVSFLEYRYRCFIYYINLYITECIALYVTGCV